MGTFNVYIVPLKSKLTVTRILILEMQDSILETFEDRVSRLKDRVSSFDDWGLRIEFQISSRESALSKSVHLPFILKITALCIGWDSFTFA